MEVCPTGTMDAQDYWQTVTGRRLEPCIKGPFSFSRGREKNVSCTISGQARPFAYCGWEKSPVTGPLRVSSLSKFSRFTFRGSQTMADRAWS